MTETPNPQLNFTLKVAAVRNFDINLDEFDKMEFPSFEAYREFLQPYKINIDLDLSAAFSTELSTDGTPPAYQNNFDAISFRKLLQFISTVVTRKVVEQVYFAGNAGYEPDAAPKGYHEVQKIYAQRKASGNVVENENRVKAIVDEFISSNEILDGRFDAQRENEQSLSRLIVQNFNPLHTYTDRRTKINGERPPL